MNWSLYIDQTCSEIVIPIGIGNDTMFQPNPYDLKRFAKACHKQFGVSPRPHWVTTYYGGHVSTSNLFSSYCNIHIDSFSKRFSILFFILFGEWRRFSIL